MLELGFGHSIHHRFIIFGAMDITMENLAKVVDEMRQQLGEARETIVHQQALIERTQNELALTNSSLEAANLRKNFSSS